MKEITALDDLEKFVLRLGYRWHKRTISPSAEWQVVKKKFDNTSKFNFLAELLNRATRVQAALYIPNPATFDPSTLSAAENKERTKNLIFSGLYAYVFDLLLDTKIRFSPENIDLLLNFTKLYCLPAGDWLTDFSLLNMGLALQHYLSEYGINQELKDFILYLKPFCELASWDEKIGSKKFVVLYQNLENQYISLDLLK